MITLGLQRITQLLNPLFTTHPILPWKAVHIAGTNGKGSVAALISTLLRHDGYKVGRFTSPHLLDRWDCITIDHDVIKPEQFLPVEQHFRNSSAKGKIGASEFEILTATAFQLFTDQKVDIAVIECGLGGREDATNALRPQDAILTVLTKVGLDHTEFLGNTIEAITTEKAGIFKPGIPVVVDQSNPETVFQVVRKQLKTLGWEKDGQEGIYVSHEEERRGFSEVIQNLRLATYQKQNLYTAWSSYEHAKISLRNSPQTRKPPHEKKTPSNGLITSPIGSVKACLKWLLGEAQSSLPGRLQWLTLPSQLLPHRISGHPGKLQGDDLVTKTRVLLDGAHNPQSAEGLAIFVAEHLRDQAWRPITWLLAVKDDKDADKMLSTLLQPHDNVVTCSFGPIDGMPWVKPMPATDLTAKVRKFTTGIVTAIVDEDEAGDIRPIKGDMSSARTSRAIREAVRLATEQDKQARLCITGSLYLVGDVLRCVQDAGGSIYGPG